MVPNFALALSFEGIGLLRRVGPHWARIGDVPIDHADLDVAVIALRDRAESLDPKGADVALIIPNEQIRYLDIPDPGGDAAAREVAIRAALNGATPYALRDLTFDHVSSAGRLLIAAVAKETLEEAETFARDHGFTPVCHVARAPDGAFDGAVFFGKAARWRRMVERPGRAIEEIAATPEALVPVAKPEPQAKAEVVAETDAEPVVSEPVAEAELAPATETVTAPELAPQAEPTAVALDDTAAKPTRRAARKTATEEAEPLPQLAFDLGTQVSPERDPEAAVPEVSTDIPTDIPGEIPGVLLTEAPLLPDLADPSDEEPMAELPPMEVTLPDAADDLPLGRALGVEAEVPAEEALPVAPRPDHGKPLPPAEPPVRMTFSSIRRALFEEGDAGEAPAASGHLPPAPRPNRVAAPEALSGTAAPASQNTAAAPALTGLGKARFTPILTGAEKTQDPAAEPEARRPETAASSADAPGGTDRTPPASEPQDMTPADASPAQVQQRWPAVEDVLRASQLRAERADAPVSGDEAPRIKLPPAPPPIAAQTPAPTQAPALGAAARPDLRAEAEADGLRAPKIGPATTVPDDEDVTVRAPLPSVAALIPSLAGAGWRRTAKPETPAREDVAAERAETSAPDVTLKAPETADPRPDAPIAAKASGAAEIDEATSGGGNALSRALRNARGSSAGADAPTAEAQSTEPPRPAFQNRDAESSAASARATGKKAASEKAAGKARFKGLGRKNRAKSQTAPHASPASPAIKAVDATVEQRDAPTPVTKPANNPNPLVRLAALRTPAATGVSAASLRGLTEKGTPGLTKPLPTFVPAPALSPSLDGGGDPARIAAAASAGAVTGGSAGLTMGSARGSNAVPVIPPKDAPARKSLPQDRKAQRPRVSQSADERDRMTVFGARQNQPVKGKPRYMGLVLTGTLLVALAGLWSWSSVFSEGGLSGLFGGGEEVTAVTAPVGATDGAPLIDTGAPDVTTGGDQVAALPPEAAAPVDTAPGAAVDAVVPTPQSPIAEPEDVPALTQSLTPQEAIATYAATGIWQSAPTVPMTPPADAVDDVYLASIDPQVQASDAIALPDLETVQRDLPVPPPGLPPAAGVTFDIDARGVVRATPEGALTPEGMRVYAGLPPATPPLRFPAGTASDATPAAVGGVEAPAAPPPEETGRLPDNGVTPPEGRPTQASEDGAEASPAATVPSDPLGRVRPEARPDDVIEQRERATFSGISRDELARLRPVLRPQTAQEAAEAEEPSAPATQQAVRASLIPVTRPRDMATIVQRAEEARPTEPVQTAAVAPQSVQPSIPSSAGVAQSATLRNAINLNKINLIGVYGTPSNRRALVRLASGKYLKVKVGDSLDGGKVAAISEAELRYVKRGRNVTLQMPRG